MRKISRKLSNKKKSILSLLLAFILMLTFNYAPMGLLANKIRESVNAYKSENIQSYYPSTQLGTESNISSANFPSSLADYFKNSQVNFNILEYYNSRFSDIFGKIINDYFSGNLTNIDSESKTYKEVFAIFLSSKGYDSIYDYYSKNSPALNSETGSKDFRSYVEYFMSHDISFDEGGINHVLTALYPVSENNHYQYLSLFYNNVANNLDGTQTSIPNEDGKYDGIDTSKDYDFHTDSVSYNRIKTHIDTEIEKTVAIYTYDGKTQNKNVLSIFANGAPTAQKYYYKDNSFETVNKPNEVYSETTTSGNQSLPTIYYFHEYETSDNIQSTPEYETYKSRFSINDISERNKDILSYRKLQPGESGYIPGYVTYYRFRNSTSSTYEMVGNSGNIYQLYSIVNSSVLSADQKATFDFLFTKTMTNSEYLNSKDFYVQIPYSEGSDGELYFRNLFGSNFNLSSTYKKNLVNLFTKPSSDYEQDRSTLTSSGNKIYVLIDNTSNITNFTALTKAELDEDIEMYGSNGYYVEVPSDVSNKLNQENGGNYRYFYKHTRQSNLYFKLQPSSERLVYLVGTTAQKQELEKTYKYNVTLIDPTTFESIKNDYTKITTSYSDYYKDGYDLYFQKVKVEYKIFDTSSDAYTGEYEKKASPNIPYVTQFVPGSSFIKENGQNKIYILLNSDESGDTLNGYKTINNDELSRIRNLYIEVPASVIEAKGLDKNHKYYYKHNEVEVDKIYIVDDSNNAKDNEVYKNLNYEVIKSSEYNYSDYVALSSNDPNFNKNFKLYYKYNFEKFEDSNGSLYVKNLLRKDTSSSDSNKNSENAIFIVDDSLTGDDRTRYRDNNYTVITSTEFNENASFYVQIVEGDPNYSTTYTKLYYKYNESTTEFKPVVYLYSSSSSSLYKTFYHTNSGYIAEDYVLIPAGDENFVEGLELYYKKVRRPEAQVETKSDVQKTTYYYQTSSNISLKANSYYVISFYVYTQGNVDTSVYITDTSNIIDNIEIKNIMTNGTWQKYYAFISTDSLATSSINIKFYLGDDKSIGGILTPANPSRYVTGTVLFDDIKITKINQTEFNNRSIDGKVVTSTPLTSGEGDDKVELPDRYADDYNNEVFVLNDIDPDSSSITLTGSMDNRTKTDINVPKFSNFADMVNFDQMLKNQETSGDLATLNNLTLKDGVDGFSPLTDLWQYYISRDNSGQGNEYVLSVLQDAYKKGNAKISLISEETIDKTDKDEEDSDDKDDSDKEDDEDVKTVSNTFNKENKVLKIENSDRLLSLGVISNGFILKQSMFYKITVWIYSPDKEAKAVVGVESYLKTNSSTTNSSTLSVSASVDANISEYTTAPTNEYGWIPVSIYIEGNALHNQECYLVLAADKNSTVYFDNITIETTTSASYDTANSDSDNTTHCLSLTPTSSVLSAGVTNGYFNNVNVTDNYKTISNNLPRTAKNWTVKTSNSKNVIAGVVPTSSDYLALPNNFYSEYKVSMPTPHTMPTNIYAIHAPGTTTSSILNGTNVANSTSIYQFYSSSISLSANSVYKLSFQFAKGDNLSENARMTANLYHGSVDSKKIISKIKVDVKDIPDTIWQTYTFYIATGTASASVYLELGIENAVGSCFFQKVASTTTTDSLDKIRDNLVEDADGNFIIKENGKLSNSRFIDLNNSKFTINDGTINENNGLYPSNEYIVEETNTSSYTVGQTGVVVANFYTTEIDYKYSVTINKVEYYIKAFTNEETNEVSYKLFSDSNYKNEVTKIDGKPVTIDSLNVVTVGTTSKTDYDTTKTEIRNHVYHFTDKDSATTDEMLEINNVFIPKSELTNAQSQNVLILANGYSTDFTVAAPSFSNSLKTSAFYVLKVYVKTSDFDTENFGLNITVNSISSAWTNINTTKLTSNKDNTDSALTYTSNKDEYGFVCYQVLITTNTSSISNLSVNFSLGSKVKSGSGYAIISGVELETFATEKLFNEYAENFENDETTTKKYFGTASNSNDDDNNDNNNEASTWATFFYIFSSLLLVIVLVVALVAVIIKRHPIKVNKVEQNEHEREGISTTSTKSSKSGIMTENDEVKETKSKPSRSVKSNGSDEGFV